MSLILLFFFKFQVLSASICGSIAFTVLVMALFWHHTINRSSRRGAPISTSNAPNSYQPNGNGINGQLPLTSFVVPDPGPYCYPLGVRRADTEVQDRNSTKRLEEGSVTLLPPGSNPTPIGANIDQQGVEMKVSWDLTLKQTKSILSILMLFLSVQRTWLLRLEPHLVGVVSYRGMSSISLKTLRYLLSTLWNVILLSWISFLNFLCILVFSVILPFLARTCHHDIVMKDLSPEILKRWWSCCHLCQRPTRIVSLSVKICVEKLETPRLTHWTSLRSQKLTKVSKIEAITTMTFTRVMSALLAPKAVWMKSKVEVAVALWETPVRVVMT